ncbi:MAG: hypothetical protein AAF478_05500 [Pseudomonadota bacterium]
MRNSKYTAIALVALALSGFSLPAHAKKLSAAEIQNEFIGHKMKYRSRGNRVGTITFNRNKTIRWNSLSRTGVGEWRAEGDRLCVYLAPAGSWQGVDWFCRNITKRGSKYRLGSFSYQR